MYAYRRIGLSMLLKAPSGRGAELSEVIGDKLLGYGRVEVHDDGEYWKFPEYLRFHVDLWPDGPAPECAQALGLSAGTAGLPWDSEQDGLFLHPAVAMVLDVDVCETHSPPRFAFGDVVRAGDIEGSVHGRNSPTSGNSWHYVVSRTGSAELLSFGEAELELAVTPSGGRLSG
jgi:hypothetical protein